MSEFKRLMETQAAAVAEYASVKEAFKKKMQNEFVPIFRAFLTEFPEIRAITWTQYTPYFNDGEVCEFSVNNFNFKIASNLLGDAVAEDDDDDYEDDESGNFPHPPSRYVYDSQDRFASYRRQIEYYDSVVTRLGSRYDEVVEAIATMRAHLNSIPDEIYLTAFDDHQRVVATIDGIETEEYEHD